MSMILDALRKSDRERARSAADRLREGPTAAGSAGPGGRLAVTGAVILLAAIAAVLLAAWPKAPSDRALTRKPAETVQNSPAITPAPVRDLASELAPVEAPAVAEPVAPETVTRTEIVENLAAPPIEALPAAIRIRLPELHLNIHAWAEDPGERFVLINLRRYREGDRLQEGPVLHRILRNGVVLEFEGTLFSLPRH